MLRRLPWQWVAPTLLVGIGLGLAVDSWPAVRPLQARPADTAPSLAASQADVTPLSAASGQLAEIAAGVMPSVVHIESKLTSANRGLIEETGSGVIITHPKAAGYYVVTNRHVIGDASELAQISVRLADGRAFHPSRKWTDPETDIAVLKIDAATAKAAPWGDSDRLQIGNFVLAVGSPFGLSQSVTMGIVSARGRALHIGRRSDLVNQDFIQTDAAINFGNSGGPLIDLTGRVVGINTAIASNSGGNDGIGFSIPSNLAKRVVSELLDRGQVQRAYLGVMLDPDFTAEKAVELKLDRRRGARIVRVYPSSPAARANLLNDDVVLTFDGVDVIDENHLINLVSLTEVGRKVVLGVLRDGRKIEVTVHLSNRQEMGEERSDARSRPDMGSRIDPLGLTLHEVSPGLARQLGLGEATHGLLVLRVDPTSALAGSVEVYDVLQEIGRVPVASVDDLRKALHAAKEDAVLLRFQRGGAASARSHVVVWRR
jgi:serine protease Do